jgi:lipid-binding SYLF domain-containing protein
MNAEMLSYSRARGLFAGVSLEGSTLRSDNEADKLVYGKDLSARDIVTSTVDIPAAARPMIDLLNKRAPKNLSDRK